MKGWPHSIQNGVFVQLEALKPVQNCWFVSSETKQTETVSTDFKLLEPIFR